MENNEIKNSEIVENNTEKALVAQGDSSLASKKKFNILPILKVTTGIVFYAATFIVSIAIGYIFIFSVFN